MPTIQQVLDAETTIRAARTLAADLSAGDRVVYHVSEPGSFDCTISKVGTVVSSVNMTPARVYPDPSYTVTLAGDDGTTHRFGCSGKFTGCLRAS